MILYLLDYDKQDALFKDTGEIDCGLAISASYKCTVPLGVILEVLIGIITSFNPRNILQQRQRNP